MNSGQRITFELLVVLGVMMVFASSYGRGFWQTLFTRVPLQIEAPQLTLPSLLSGGALNIGSVPPPDKNGGKQ